uniref:Uncharacterized protein n=1 Tax=viral metagenome TaxID=1070528 RepID=A0A6C0AE63_9ZZZZ
MNKTILKQINNKMTDELFAFLTSEDRKNPIDEKTANKIILNTKEYIEKKAKKMYLAYEKDNELDEIENAENDWYREYLKEFFKIFSY